MCTSKKNIVVVDNQAEYLNSANKILVNSYNIITLDNCDSLMPFLSDNPVNLLIVSVSLEKQYFFSLLADIHQKWLELPIILSYDNETTYQNMCTYYLKVSQAVIKKPFNPEQLLSLIKDTLKKYPFTTTSMVNQGNV